MRPASLSRRNLLLGGGAAGTLALGAMIYRELYVLRSRTRSSVFLRRVMRLPTRGPVATGGTSEITSLAWNGSGTRIAASFDWGHAVIIIDAATWKEVGRIEERFHTNLKSTVFLSDTELLALGIGRDSQNAFAVYDIATGNLRREIACLASCPTTFTAAQSQSVTITSNRNYAVLATSYPSSRLLLFNLRSGEFIGDLAGGSKTLLPAIAAGPGDRLAASANADPDPKIRKEIYLVDPITNKVTLVVQGHIPSVSSLAWSPDGKWLASGAFGFKGDTTPGREAKWIRDNDPVRVWDTSTGKLVVSFGGEIESVSDLTWHPSGRVLAGVGARGDGGVGTALRLWSVPDRKMIFEYFVPHPSFFFRHILPTGGHITALSFHPVTGQLVMGYNEGLEVFDVSGLT